MLWQSRPDRDDTVGCDSSQRWFGWTISAPRVAFLFKSLRQKLLQSFDDVLQPPSPSPSKSNALSKKHMWFFGWGGIIHPNTISLYWFIDQPLIFDPSNDVWSWSHLDPGSWGTQVHQLCQRPNLEDGLPTGDLLVITMVNHDHHPLGAHPLRVVGGRLPEGLGNLRDEISRWQSGGLIRIDSGQICIIPKPECFGHLGGRFPY